MPELSVIIITKNEAHNIRDCIESVSWANQIVIVDSGSSDGTPEICRELGAEVHEHDWPGFGVQKNRALDYARNDWVLSLDADERITPESCAEVLEAISDDKIDGYFLPRLSQFCGTFIRHSGWYPDYVLRLFRKGTGRFSEDLVHESLILHGRSAKLLQPILHYSYLDTKDVERKIEHYSTSGAQQLFDRGKSANILDAPVRSAWAFFRTYCLRLGLLDGIAGFNVARMNARTTYLKYAKLRTLKST